MNTRDLVYSQTLHAGLIAALLAMYWAWPAPREFVPISLEIDEKSLEDIRKNDPSVKTLKMPQETLQIPSDKKPENARYFSDRNRSFPREQRTRRAQLTSTLFSPPKSAPLNIQRSQAQRNEQIETGDGPNIQPRGAQSTEPRSNGGPQQTSFMEYIGNDDLVVDAENWVNTVQSPYFSFFARFREALGPVWQAKVQQKVDSSGIQERLRNGRLFFTRAMITVDEGGHVTALKIIHSAGLDILDEAVIEAFERVGSFPNPPSDLLKDGKFQFTYGFLVEIGPLEGGGNRYFNVIPRR